MTSRGRWGEQRLRASAHGGLLLPSAHRARSIFLLGPCDTAADTVLLGRAGTWGWQRRETTPTPIHDQEQLVPGSHRHLCPGHGAGGDPGTTPVPGHREVDGHATGKSWSRQEVPISVGNQTVAGVSFFMIWEDEEACDI